MPALFVLLKIIAAWNLRPGHFEQEAAGRPGPAGPMGPAGWPGPGAQPGPAGPMGPGVQLLAAGLLELEAQPEPDLASAAAVAEAPADSQAAAEPETPAGTAGAVGNRRPPLVQLHRLYERD